MIGRDAERRLLQAATALGCVVPVWMGGLSLLRGADVLKGISGTVSVDLDSHYRYLSGLLLGVGIVFLASIPKIEQRGTVFQVLGTLIVVGGIGRLLSLITTGSPSGPHLFGLVMELAVTPLLVLWQARVARIFGHQDEGGWKR